MSESIKNLLRWIAVFPGSLLAGALSLFPLHWLLYLNFEINPLRPIELPPEYISSIEYLLSPLIFTLAYIYVGGEIAPKYKFKTAIILTALFILLLGMILFVLAIKD